MSSNRPRKSLHERLREKLKEKYYEKPNDRLLNSCLKKLDTAFDNGCVYFTLQCGKGELDECTTQVTKSFIINTYRIKTSANFELKQASIKPPDGVDIDNEKLFNLFKIYSSLSL